MLHTPPGFSSGKISIAAICQVGRSPNRPPTGQKPVEVAVLADAEEEGDETFVVSIGSATGYAAVADPLSVAVTIPGTDTPGPPPPDTTAPETTIDKGPKKKTAKRTAKFKFSSNEVGSTFECKVDKRKWRECTSPKIYRRLKRGRHVFRVRATDPAANVDSTPAKHKWKITRPRRG
jgi:hypothetical protein